jgi:rubredoxin
MAYNEVEANVACPGCGRAEPLQVQFKYGNLYRHRYVVGDQIIWGDTQIGDPSEREVVVYGVSSCPSCGVNKDFDIHIDGGVIRSVEPSRGIYDYHHGEGFYVVIDDDKGLR